MNTIKTPFPFRLTEAFRHRIDWNNPNDPLLIQIWPMRQELEKIEGYELQPLNEADYNPIPGLLHKYHGRVLLTLTSACPIHCRYCFRRNFPYKENIITPTKWARILNYLRKDSSITEVILSGGDPLMIKDAQLKSLINDLEKISHLNILRIHTRVPIAEPSRVNESLLDWLLTTRFKTVMVLHCNHPQEIDAAVNEAIQQLKTTGIVLLNQSVLLKDVNDNASVLAELSERLFSCGVLPYYLHRLDRVQGAAHFEVPDEKAEKLMKSLRALLPGYLVPRFVTETPGEPSKILIE